MIASKLATTSVANFSKLFSLKTSSTTNTPTKLYSILYRNISSNARENVARRSIRSRITQLKNAASEATGSTGQISATRKSF